MALLLLVLVTVVGCTTRTAAGLHVEELRIPVSFPDEELVLEGLVVRPDKAGTYPMVVLTHGAPRLARQRANRRASDLLHQAAALAEAGWTAAVIVRRGYGASGGEFAEGYGRCDDPDYVRAGNATAEDLRAAVRYLRTLDFVDPNRVAVVGQSAGGFGAVALSASPAPGMVAAVSIAGGRGSRSSGEVCSPARLVEAFSKYGAAAQVPMLWLYPDENDYFPRPLVEALHGAYTRAGGTATLRLVDGDHNLFYRPAEIEHWRRIVIQFLSEYLDAR